MLLTILLALSIVLLIGVIVLTITAVGVCGGLLWLACGDVVLFGIIMVSIIKRKLKKKKRSK